MESVVLEEWFAVPPKRLYRAWLDSEEHGAFTGGEAEIDPVPGGAFSAWDGYISGTTIGLDPPRRIEQSWRTSDFPPDAPDSRLVLELHAERGGTRLVLRHTEMPEGQGADYAQGWIDHYFEPMKSYWVARS